jgi:hypothetical protein
MEGGKDERGNRRQLKCSLAFMRWISATLTVLVLAIILGGCSASGSSLGPDSAPTRSTKAILFRLNHGDLGETVPVHPCRLVRSGGIGPLNAPYKVCAISTAEGHFVNFIAIGRTPEQGITYTDRGPATFLDECYMHITGRWWEFRAADLSNPSAPCSGPWHFHGGP